MSDRQRMIDRPEPSVAATEREMLASLA